MKPNEIAAELKKVGSSQAQIARELGLKWVTQVNSVIYRRDKNKSDNPKIRLAIAEKLGLPVDEVFKEHDNDCNTTIIKRETVAVNGKP